MTKLDWAHRTATRGTPRMRSRRLLVALAALVSALALIAGGPTGIALGDENDKDKDKKAVSEAEVKAAAPISYTPKSKTTFNNPQSSTSSQRKIIDELNRTINGTPGGATIRIAAYLFDATTTADALVAAHRRGVNVQMLIDDGERDNALVRVRRVVGTDTDNRSYVTTCSSGCHAGSPSIIHAKIYLFSRVGSASNVSMVGSANPYYHNVFNSWNNMQTIVNNATIYNSLSAYFNEMLDEPNDGNAYRETTSGAYKLYFFPKASGKPMILEVLEGVSCSGVASGYGSGGKTVVRIAMWGWTAAREDIALELNALHRRGCKVEVLLNKDRTSKTVFAALLRSSSTYGKMKIYDGWYDGNDNGVAGLYVHHKVLMINGNWFSDSGAKVVYTGSQNHTHEGLRRNNEVMLRVKINGVYNAFYYNFAYIRDRWTKGRITSVPSFVGEQNSAELRRQGLDQEQEIEAAIDPDIGWYVPPGEVADSD